MGLMGGSGCVSWGAEIDSVWGNLLSAESASPLPP